MNWRRECIATLAASPQEWHRLSELFAAVETEIPIHIAMRFAARNGGRDIGLNTARWRLFLGHVGSMTERKATDGEARLYRAQRTDLVRLRPHEIPCAACGGPCYLVAWPDRGKPRRYACLKCQPATLPTKPEPLPAPSHPLPPAAVTPARTGAGIPDGTQILVRAESQQVLFENRRTLARNVRNFLGLGSINAIDRELQRTDIATVLARYGKTIIDFVRRAVFQAEFNKHQSGYPP